MSEFRLPRLPSRFPIANRDGTPSLDMQRWWQNVVGDIETQVNDILTAQAAAAAARAAAGLAIVGSAAIVIEAETNGNVASGQLPANYTYSLENDGATVTDSVTWAVTVTEGDAAVSVSGGVLTVTSLSSNSATLRLTATYQGSVKPMAVTLRKRIAAVDINTGTGGTSATDNSFNSFSSTSYAVVSDTLVVDTGTNGVVELSAPLDFRVNSGSPTGIYECTLRWQQDVSGVWTDVGSEHPSASECEVDSTGTVFAGFVSASESLSLSTSTSYSFRLVAKANAADGVNRYLTGTASASGS